MPVESTLSKLERRANGGKSLARLKPSHRMLFDRISTEQQVVLDPANRTGGAPGSKIRSTMAATSASPCVISAVVVAVVVTVPSILHHFCFLALPLGLLGGPYHDNYCSFYSGFAYGIRYYHLFLNKSKEER